MTLNLDVKVTELLYTPSTYSLLYGQLTRDLFAIAKFLLSIQPGQAKSLVNLYDPVPAVKEVKEV